jgi:RNA polymerase sigma-70 factor
VVEEVVEGLLEKLVLGPKPKLAQYAGRSRLRTWLKTVAIHAAQDRLRKREPQPSRDRRGHDGGGDGLGADEAGFVDAHGVNAEGEYARWVSKEELRRAVLEALERLTPVQRTMLRALYVERLTLKELGAPEGLEPSTMFRRLQQIYKVIRAAVHDILQERLKLSPTQCDSLMRSMFSQMDLRLSQLLPA